MTSVILSLLLFASAAEAARLSGPSPRVDAALKLASKTYGVPYGQIRAVAYCESRWDARAVGDGSYGLLQFLRSTWANTPYRARDIFDPKWNALAAGWLWRHDHRSWHEWTCGRMLGYA